MKFILALLLLGSVSAMAQSTITGHVTDAETHEPLSGASVFAQNTTKGTTTASDGSYTLVLEKGGYELVYSFSGYENRRISVEQGGDRKFEIELTRQDNAMQAVVITNSFEVADGWNQYGKLFTSRFIGSTPFADSCTLLNPEAVHFYYYKKSDKLKVLATEPLKIENRALGYNIRYDLDSFIHVFPTAVENYRGVCLYTEMEGSYDQIQNWRKNREAAYPGSRLHFLRSYYDRTLAKEGFTVSMLSKTDRYKFNMLSKPYDSAYYYFDTTSENAELYFDRKFSVEYRKQKPDPRYLEETKLPKDVPYQISYVTLADGIVVKPNGYYFDQSAWVNEGYWSWKNLADQLPYDFEPGD